MLKVLNDFVKFAAKELDLRQLPKIHFVGKQENKYNAFGHSIDSEIYIRITNRHPGDVMRTIAHELIHQKQKESGGKSEQFKEDQANAIAGRIMRKYNTKYPNVFKLKHIASNIAETESLGAANAMGDGQAIAKYDPLLGSKAVIKRKLNDIIGSKAIRRELNKDR